MKLQYSMKNMVTWEEKRMREYMQDKTPSLEKLMTHFQDDTVSLTVRAERFDKNNAYQVELILEVPGKVLIGKEDSHSIEKAVDLSKDRLVHQLKKHEDQLKNKGKSNSYLKRGIKELGDDRAHRAVTAPSSYEDMDLESIVSSESESNPINTL